MFDITEVWIGKNQGQPPFQLPHQKSGRKEDGKKGSGKPEK